MAKKRWHAVIFVCVILIEHA